MKISLWLVEANPEHLDLARPFEWPGLVIKSREQEQKISDVLTNSTPEAFGCYLREYANNRVTKNYGIMRRIHATCKSPAILERTAFEIKSGIAKKIVIFAYHREPLQVLNTIFPGEGITADIIWKGTPLHKTAMALVRFKRPNHRGGIPILLIQISAAPGLVGGIEADHVIINEQHWLHEDNELAYNLVSAPRWDNALLQDNIDQQIAPFLTGE